MAAVPIRSPDVRRPEPLTATRHAIEVDRATLRELQTLVGEQGMFEFRAVPAMSLLLPESMLFLAAVRRATVRDIRYDVNSPDANPVARPADRHQLIVPTRLRRGSCRHPPGLAALQAIWQPRDRKRT